MDHTKDNTTGPHIRDILSVLHRTLTSLESTVEGHSKSASATPATTTATLSTPQIQPTHTSASAGPSRSSITALPSIISPDSDDDFAEQPTVSLPSAFKRGKKKQTKQTLIAKKPRTTKPKKSVLKDVVCLAQPEFVHSRIKAPSYTDLADLSAKGLIGIVQLFKEMTPEEVRAEITSVFAPLFPLSDFEYSYLKMQLGSRHLCEPLVSKSIQFTGETVLSLCGQGKLYVYTLLSPAAQKFDDPMPELENNPSDLLQPSTSTTQDMVTDDENSSPSRPEPPIVIDDDLLPDVHQMLVDRESSSDQFEETRPNLSTQRTVRRHVCPECHHSYPETDVACLICIQNEEYRTSLENDSNMHSSGNDMVSPDQAGATAMSNDHPNNGETESSDLPRNIDELRSRRLARLDQEISNNENQVDVFGQDKELCNTLKDSLLKLRLALNQDGPRNNINVTRTDPVDGLFNALRRTKFCEYNLLDVQFVSSALSQDISEGAVDLGGPTRELLDLVNKDLKSLPIWDVVCDGLILKRDEECLEDEVYKHTGQVMALCLIHGGPAPSFLSKKAFSILFEEGSINLSPDYVGDPTLRAILLKASEAEPQDAATLIYSDATLSALVGLRKPIMTLDDRHRVIKQITKYLVLTNTVQAYTQMRAGLSLLDLATEVQRNPPIFLEAFTSADCYDVTPSRLRELLKSVVYSRNEQKRRDEEKRYCWLLEMITSIDDYMSTLGDILQFITGVSTIPPIGFSPMPSVTFVHEDQLPVDRRHHVYPMSHTCDNQLKLPVVMRHRTMKKFCLDMDMGFKGSQGFSSDLSVL